MKTVKTVNAPKAKAVKAAPKTTTAKAPAAITARRRSVPAPAAKSAAKSATKAVTASSREITTELIAARAYVIWEQQGRPHGRDVANWLLAESQLKQEIQAFTA